MTKEDLKTYIKRFPTSTQLALKNEDYVVDFITNTRVNYSTITVYRAVKREDFFDGNDFLSIIESKIRMRKIKPEKIETMINKNKVWNIYWFGTSVNEDIEELKNALKYPFGRHKGIVKGLMTKENGLADFIKNNTHHNWYIFQDRMNEVVNSFEYI